MAGGPLGRYGERGLAREGAAVWLYGESRTLEYADELLAQDKVRYQPDKAQLLTVAEPRLFETPYHSPQLPLWELSDAEWLKMVRRPDYAPRKARHEGSPQPTLFVLDAG